MSISHITWPEAKDYFRAFSLGIRDQTDGRVILYAQDQVRTSDSGQFLYVGRAGSGGIEFVYQKGSPEIWAFFPIEGDLQWKADCIGDFVAGWLSGEIQV